VHFAYPDGTPVLQDVSFTVPRGSRCALVGPSGAGKSTVLALVERFYDVDAGAVLVGGHDVRDLPRTALRACLGYVEQEAPVLAGTLRDNLLLAAPHATDDEVLAVLASVNLLGVAERSPLGLEAQVGDGGVLLSGGERQRPGHRAVAAGAPRRPAARRADGEPGRAQRAGAARRRRRRGRRPDGAGGGAPAVDGGAQRPDRGARRGPRRRLGTHAELMETSPLYRDLATTQLLT
jgi:ABC-type ATPase involved in cell division